MAKSKGKQLQKKILSKSESVWNKYPAKSIHNYAEPYKAFLNENKTEREVVEWAERKAKEAGYTDIDKQKSIKPGELLYKKTHKNFVLIKYQGLDQLNMVISHIDSPRLDLKPRPLIEDGDLSWLKTHYYGGIVKYQWVNIPLAIHGIIIKKDGKKITLKLGEDPTDPIFVISDLLPHLGRDRIKNTADKIIVGENLNIAFGNIPFKDKAIQEQFKLQAMNVLNQKYGLLEEDFASAELEIVPALEARDCGIDRSMIAAYGQDDRVCAFSSYDSLIKSKKLKHTGIALFFDKEEIGSEGKTGANSDFLRNLVKQLIAMSGQKAILPHVLENTNIISSDVTAAYDPQYKEFFDASNASYLGKGVSIEKYTGYGGKFGTNDASAEYLFTIRALLNKNKIPWQYGEMGKIDDGGCGTIAVFVAGLGAEVVDAGPPVLGMHSPYEIVSKADLYSTHLLYKAFFEQM